MMNKPINFIRHMPGRSPFDLTIQLPMWSLEDMRKVAQPLIEEIGGEPGLLYTALFRWDDLPRVTEFFEQLGYEIVHKDERERDLKLKKLLGEE